MISVRVRIRFRPYSRIENIQVISMPMQEYALGLECVGLTISQSCLSL